jgi:hypothetical protein
MKVLGVTDADDTAFANVTILYLEYQKPRVSEDTYERLEGIIEIHRELSANTLAESSHPAP